MCEISCICKCYPTDGYVVETKAPSWSGRFLYSDCSVGKPDYVTIDDKTEHDTFLNKWSRIAFIGIFAGIARVAIAIIHTLGHLFAACFTRQKGHLFHAAKGASELLRGLLEAIPVGGRIFASAYNPVGCGRSTVEPDLERGRTWWILKIYNPASPDAFDCWMNNWRPSHDSKGQLPYTEGGSRYIKA